MGCLIILDYSQLFSLEHRQLSFTVHIPQVTVLLMYEQAKHSVLALEHSFGSCLVLGEHA